MLPSEANSRIKPSCSPPIKSEIAFIRVPWSSVPNADVISKSLATLVPCNLVLADWIASNDWLWTWIREKFSNIDEIKDIFLISDIFFLFSKIIKKFFLLN